MTHGAEALGIRIDERHELDVIEMKFMKSICAVTRMDRWRKEEVRRGNIVQ